jgi:xanthine dehydrogenase accessory factor
VARLGSLVGFDVHVIDDREQFANRERFPHAAAVIVDDVAEWLGRERLPAGAYVVVVTRGHRHDFDALRALVGQDFTYLGLIGSRAKIARLYDLLISEGVAAEELRRVHAPIGLDIGAVTPEEIAVAIIAELIAVKYGKLGHGTSPGFASVRSSRWQPPALVEHAGR